MPLSLDGHGFRCGLVAMPARRLRILVLLAVLCYGALFQLNRSAPFFYVQVSNLFRDALARTGRLTAPNPDLVFLAIDADSISLDATTDAVEMYGLTNPKSTESRAFSLMTQRYPWSREVYGLILDRLIGAGAKVVMFDMTFPSETQGDQPFRQALDRYHDRVIIGSNFVNPSWNGLARIGASMSRPTETLIPATVPMDDRVAFTNFWPDLDDVVRRAQYCVTFEQIQGEEPRRDSERFLSLGARATQKAGFGENIPPDLQPRFIRFTGPPGQGFPPHSLFEIFVPDYWVHNYGGGEFFRGKIVIVGAQGAWQHDEHQTPFGSMPGPELHLNAINAALKHEFINEMSPAMVSLLTALAAIVAVALSVGVRSPWLRLLVLAIATLIAGWAVLLIFNRMSLYVPLISPLAQLNLTVLLGLVTDFTQERMEKKRVRLTLERYVSRDLVAEMLDHPAAYQQSLGGVIKPVTILFSDIRGYSLVAAQSEPHLLVRQLNEYLTAMVECVFRFGGTLDKFIGDAVMAVWGNIHSHSVTTDALNAVRAAQAMQQRLGELNETWKARGWPELRVGTGLNHGEVVVGNIGSPQRMEFTVIGDTVNVSWRLQEMTKQHHTNIILSASVARLVANQFNLRCLGTVKVGGSQKSIEIYELDPQVAASKSLLPVCHPAEFIAAMPIANSHKRSDLEPQATPQ